MKIQEVIFEKNDSMLDVLNYFVSSDYRIYMGWLSLFLVCFIYVFYYVLHVFIVSIIFTLVERFIGLILDKVRACYRCCFDNKKVKKSDGDININTSKRDENVDKVSVDRIVKRIEGKERNEDDI